MSLGSESAYDYDYDYILKHLVKELLRDLWDDEIRRKFLAKFVRGPIEEGARPFVGIGMGESKDSKRTQLQFLSTIDGARLRIKELLSTWDWGDVRFEVMNTGRILAAATTGTVSKRAQGGDAIQRKGGQSGTFGCLVDGSFGSGILTCHHVLVLSINNKQKHEILWSGRRIGLLETLEPLVLGPNGDNKIDAAVCKPDNLSAVAPGLRNLGLISGYVANPVFGLKVKKEGAASGITEGAVRLKNLSTIVGFEDGDEAIFTDQLGIIGTKSRHFATQGDSGAVIIDDNSSPVGLLSAVAEQIDLTFANPIEAVFRTLQVRLP
jgi:hypothetical protein